MTMKDLARLANVSVSAVSKAFSGAEDISEDTKKHIFEVAKEHGCYNKFYKGKYPKPIIAIICPELLGSHYSSIVEYLKDVIEQGGGIALVSTDNFDNDKKLELVEYYSEYLQVDGIIVISMCKANKEFSTPIVALFNSADERVDAVQVELKHGIEKAIELFGQLGHRNIAFAGEGHTHAKAKIFEEKCRREHLHGLIFESSERFEKAGVDCAKQILAAEDKCTAILCAYDDIAVGAIKHLKREGFNIPEDFSVIGIDNISVSEYMECALTTVDEHKASVCDIAWKLLQKKIKNKYYRPKKKYVFEADLIVRDSVGKAKQ